MHAYIIIHAQLDMTPVLSIQFLFLRLVASPIVCTYVSDLDLLVAL